MTENYTEKDVNSNIFFSLLYPSRNIETKQSILNYNLNLNTQYKATFSR